MCATGVRSRLVLISAMITPILFGGMFTVLASRSKDAEEIKLPVAGSRVCSRVYRLDEATNRSADRRGARRIRSGRFEIGQRTWS